MDKKYFSELLNKYLKHEASEEECDLLIKHYNLFESEPDIFDNMSQNQKADIRNEIENKIWDEICDDEIDNNCDGNTDITDITCICDPGEQNDRCWPLTGGPIENVITNTILGPGSRLNGQCKYGMQYCRALSPGGSEWGVWDEGADSISGTDDDIWIAEDCIGATLPEDEMCDRIDNNCDGRVDESLKIECWSGARETNGDPQAWIHFYDASTNPSGVCKKGIKICVQGDWSQCLYEVLPEAETCDGIDNDCNGTVDDNLVDDYIPCGLTDIGECDYGYLVCESEVTDMICQEYKNPQEETCDRHDNDCDGLIDEDLFRPCETICESGFETCINGSYQRCTATKPVNEICDGLDNDCDGIIDEGLECTCPPELVGALLPCVGGALTCGLGFKTCIEQNGSLVFTECCAIETYLQQGELECIGGFGQIVPEVCNNYDDDCDAEIDEELIRACYSGPEGTGNIGECLSGFNVCERGRWGGVANGIFIDELCVDEALPAEEYCNDKDDDCDGLIDEGINAHDKVDLVFILDKSGSMCPYVAALTVGYATYVMDFVDTEHRFAIVEIGTKNNRSPGAYDIYDFRDATAIAQILIQWECTNVGIEPSYDAVRDVAINSILPEQLSFRNDAFPMIIIMTDEVAQSVYDPELMAADVVAALSPCRVGDCGIIEKLEVYAIISDPLRLEWCLPANIAKVCYELYHGIDGEMIRQYLEDIFSEICR